MDLITLEQAEKNTEWTVKKIDGGVTVRRRLNQMGIHLGDVVVVRRSGIMGGPLLVEVHGSEVAIGRGMAKKIIVSRE
ncbi:ferrous iron transport protein A [bacterium]|nr:ferrous iron transport protein A [bacterium]